VFMEIDYINGPRRNKIFGMFRYQMEISRRITEIQFNLIEYDSITLLMEEKYQQWFPPSQDIDVEAEGTSQEVTVEAEKVPANSPPSPPSNVFGGLVDMGRGLAESIDRRRYLHQVKRKIHPDNVKHITYQEIAYILKYIPLKRTVVTCHDLIPWVYENNRSKYWMDNIEGLKNSDFIITVSEFSKNEIIRYLDYPSQQIQVIPDAVDHDIFYPKRDKSILKTLNIPENEGIILFVGSETPRMNLNALIMAFAELKKNFNQVKLVKIGDPQLHGSRETILKLIKRLNLQEDVVFTGYVPENQLPLWYNAADLLVYPCSYAGFGLPPLEAMACGTPVITSNTTSLPEVVGDAGIMVNPTDFDLMADKIHEILTDSDLRANLAEKGLKRAKMFSWDQSAQKTLNIYENL
jgi:glycosyltransferase involved in cell wall biosynthesis